MDAFGKDWAIRFVFDVLCVTSCIYMADPIVCMSNICLLNARIFTALTAGLLGGFA